MHRCSNNGRQTSQVVALTLVASASAVAASCSQVEEAGRGNAVLADEGFCQMLSLRSAQDLHMPCSMAQRETEPWLELLYSPPAKDGSPFGVGLFVEDLLQGLVGKAACHD